MRVALRSLLACLLGLAIAFQGYASVRWMEPSCPMTHAAHAPQDVAPGSTHQGHAPTDPAHGHDHAPAGNELPSDDGPGASGHCFCPVGCQPANGFAGPELELISLNTAAPGAPLSHDFRSHAISSHWRPPAALS